MFCVFLLVVVRVVVSTNAVICLERLVPEMICNVSSGTLNSAQSFMRSAAGPCIITARYLRETNYCGCHLYSVPTANPTVSWCVGNVQYCYYSKNGDCLKLGDC